jgi:hypothetical protein
MAGIGLREAFVKSVEGTVQHNAAYVFATDYIPPSLIFSKSKRAKNSIFTCVIQPKVCFLTEVWVN